MKGLTTAALKNSSTDKSLLLSVVVQCFNNYVDIDKVVAEALPMFETEQELSVLQDAFSKFTTYPANEILTAMCEKLDETTSIDTLVNIAQYASRHDSVPLYHKTLELGLDCSNVPDKVVNIIMALSDISKSSLKPHQNEILNSLYTGFIQTTSESIQLTIITVVRKNSLTRAFKLLLKENKEKLEVFNKHA